MSSKTRNTEYGPISEKLLRADLSELCVNKHGVQTGPFGSQLHKKDYVEDGTPIITVEHLGDNRITHENTPFVSDDDKKRLSKYHLQEGDIVFSRVGSVDRRALVRKTEDGWLFSGRCLRVRVDEEKINPIYLSYFFGLESFKSYIRSIAVGATMPSLNTKILSDVPVYYPENLAEQECIAHLLYTLDEKIELNRQTNQTLEQMAQAIFKSWFVDFEPVKAKIAALEAGGSEDDALLAAMQAIAGSALFATDAVDIDAQTQLARLQAEHPEQYATLRATAELFPSAMQESELGEIPAGWFLPSFEELTTAKQGRYLSKDKMLAVANEEFKVPVWGGNGILGYAEKSAYSSPVVLMTCRGSNCGLIKYTESESWVSNNSFACSPCIGSSWFLLNYFKLSTFEDCISGSAQPQITHTALKTKQLRFPVQQQLCERYSEIINPIFNHILQLKKEIITIEETRDTLLPKLLSGELSLAAAEEQLADTVEPAHV